MFQCSRALEKSVTSLVPVKEKGDQICHLGPTTQRRPGTERVQSPFSPPVFRQEPSSGGRRH